MLDCIYFAVCEAYIGLFTSHIGYGGLVYILMLCQKSIRNSIFINLDLLKIDPEMTPEQFFKKYWISIKYILKKTFCT